MAAADYPAGLRTANRVSSTTNDDDIIVHVFAFPNAYGAKVWGRQGDTAWTVAMTKNGVVLRDMTGLPRMPHTNTVANINSILEAIDETPEGSWTVPTPDDIRAGVPAIDMRGLPSYVYGNSMGLRVASFMSPGRHYSDRIAQDFNGGPVTSYAISGTRSIDVVSALMNEQPFFGLDQPLAGAKWPGASARKGLLYLESQFNDMGHYPDMTAPLAIPTALPANNNYVDGMIGCTRAALALMSSESRIENTAATLTGTWGATDSAQPYASGGGVAFTTTIGAAAEYSVKPPQHGPLAGKVFALVYKLDPSVGASAAIDVQVDGGAAARYTPTPWEQYMGHAGANTLICPDVIPITVPVDGAAHPVKLTMATAGTMYSDAIIVPSETPSPIIFPQAALPPNPVLYSLAQIEVFKRNMSRMNPLYKAVVAEFPNAIWVPDTRTPNGMYAGDGVHPDDRGQEQRKNDIEQAIAQRLAAYFLNRVLELAPDSDYGVN